MSGEAARVKGEKGNTPDGRVVMARLPATAAVAVGPDKGRIGYMGRSTEAAT